MGDLIGVTLTGEYAFPKGVGFVADVEVGFDENIINLVTADSFLHLCHIMSILLIYHTAEDYFLHLCHILSILLIYHTAEDYLKHCNVALLQYVATLPT